MTQDRRYTTNNTTGGTGASRSSVRGTGGTVRATGSSGRAVSSSDRGTSRVSSPSSDAARRKRAAQIKRRKKVMRNRLILAAAALIIIILIIVLAVSCGGKKKPEERKTPDAAGGSITAEAGDIYSEIEKKDGDKVTTVEDTVYVRTPIEQTDREIAPSDDTDYIIRVNLAHQVTTIYRLDGAGNETPVRAFLCSTARDAHETPEGEYTLDEWYEWCG